MSLLDRFLLAFYSLGISIGLLLVGLTVGGWINLMTRYHAVMMNSNYRTAVGVIILVFIILSIRFLYLSLSFKKLPAQAVVHETDLGQVRVSVEAIENMVVRVCREIRGVKDIRPRVTCLPDGINIFARISLTPGTIVPEVSDKIQTKIKDYVTEVAGISVISVKILVDNISPDTKSGTARKLN